MQYALFADAPRQRTAEQERHTTVVNKLTSLEGEMREGFRAHLERIRGVEARVALLESSVPRYNTPSGGFPSPSRANGGQLESHVERAITLHDIKEDAATLKKIKGASSKIAVGVLIVVLAAFVMFVAGVLAHQAYGATRIVPTTQLAPDASVR